VKELNCRIILDCLIVPQPARQCQNRWWEKHSGDDNREKQSG